MKTFSIAALLVITALTFSACTSSSELTKHKWTITTSKGGGFTGVSNGFMMIETGEVFMWSGKDGSHEKTDKIGSISVRKAHKFKEALADILDTLHVNSPGDVSTSVRLEEEKQIQVITWGSPDYPNIPDGLKDWYNDFMQTCGAMQAQ